MRWVIRRPSGNSMVRRVISASAGFPEWLLLPSLTRGVLEVFAAVLVATEAAGLDGEIVAACGCVEAVCAGCSDSCLGGAAVAAVAAGFFWSSFFWSCF